MAGVSKSCRIKPKAKFHTIIPRLAEPIYEIEVNTKASEITRTERQQTTSPKAQH